MSTSKRKSTTTTSRATARSHTTRKRANSPPATSGKRRKPNHATPLQDNLFAIKDIIDEKVVNGQRYYQIDWADNPTTGESYSPTWEPEENANEDAVEDWEWKKQHQGLPGRNSDSTSDQDLSDEPTPGESPPSSIFVELQSKSDFLRSRPDFDSSEVIAISASQLSQFPHPGSQTELPPAQFCITSSHPSLDFIGDSQPGISFVAESPEITTRDPRVSQRTTIPDSQDFSNDFTQDSIPSRQPGTFLGSFETLSFSTYRNPEGEHQEVEEHQEGGNPENGDQQEECQEEDRQVSGRLPSSFEGFLTQIDFKVGDFGLSGHSTLQSQSEDVGLPQREQQSATLAEETLLEDSQQPAQRVAPLPGQASLFQTQKEEDFFSASEGYDIVPDTSKRNFGRSRQSQAWA
ncbi:hypothetical protein VMCG_02746 [Cytospora schulzeri]|uniref:Chromo domain-containing protein n=1 Tax=Cytospora schulzeri TaxID=448051 RepID=A0A423WZB0_9PEZI|nr:hypothetical protein VMCG_02746 [Valsa malicola]